MSNLLDYIILYKQKVPAELCSRIISAVDSRSLWEVARVGKNEVSPVRQCHTVSLAEWPTLDSEFFTHVSNIVNDYCSQFPYAEVTQDSGYDVLKYTKTDFYKEHIDSYASSPRVISCSIALNDNYEGGELAFFGGEKIYRLQKGDALVFPSNFLYPHQVLPVKSGTRYSIVTWLT